MTQNYPTTFFLVATVLVLPVALWVDVWIDGGVWWRWVLTALALFICALITADEVEDEDEDEVNLPPVQMFGPN